MFVQILVNNIKVLGIYGAISILAGIIGNPLLNIAESKANTLLTSGITVFTSMISLALFFFCGRLFLKGTGILLCDCLSYAAILIIFIATILVFPQIMFFFMIPHSFLVHFLSIVTSSYTISTIITVSISLIALFVGTITKTVIIR